jgi:REP element-mobilizing transposase RayT
LYIAIGGTLFQLGELLITLNLGYDTSSFGLGNTRFRDPTKVTHPMSQSLVQIYVHLVYSTKNRQRFLDSLDKRNRLYAYLAGIHKNRKSPAVIIGGVEDHVHVLCRLGKTIDISALIRDTKKDSSTWIKSELSIDDFHWQSGYGAFSISPAHVPALTKYIENQEEHHKKVSYQDEFRKLCEKYGLTIDERYVWD